MKVTRPTTANGFHLRPLYTAAVMLALFGFFDALMTYVTPLLITQRGISATTMGLIIGSSSVTGALFDFVVCKMTRRPHFRRYFFGMFALAMIYPIVLGFTTTVPLFLLAMAIWAIYYDLLNFGQLDFVGRFTPHRSHASSFGVFESFLALGYLTAPIAAGLIMTDTVGWQPLILGWIVLLLATVMFAVLLWQSRQLPETHLSSVGQYCRRRNIVAEVHLWSKISWRLAPVLFLTVFLNSIAATFWTIGPLLAAHVQDMNHLEGLFVTAFELPFVLTGFMAGKVTLRYGKKRTAFWATLVGCIILTSVGFIYQPFLLVAVAFVASLVLTLAWPALKGAYADYIGEAKNIFGEVEAIQDFFTNIGFIVGPILAGFLADQIGEGLTFTAIGVIGIVLTCILLIVTPRSISVRDMSAG